MSAKGFTLVEMLLVLGMIAMLAVCTPLLRPQSSLLLRYQMEELRYQFMQAQQLAMTKKVSIFVNFHGNEVSINQRSYPLRKQVTCQAASFHYTPMGTISQAQTITCTYGGMQRKLVVQLGSGRMYVQ